MKQWGLLRRASLKNAEGMGGADRNAEPVAQPEDTAKPATYDRLDLNKTSTSSFKTTARSHIIPRDPSSDWPGETASFRLRNGSQRSSIIDRCLDRTVVSCPTLQLDDLRNDVQARVALKLELLTKQRRLEQLHEKQRERQHHMTKVSFGLTKCLHDLQRENEDFDQWHKDCEEYDKLKQSISEIDAKIETVQAGIQAILRLQRTFIKLANEFTKQTQAAVQTELRLSVLRIDERNVKAGMRQVMSEL